jgi:hypothetical protein
MVRQPPTLDAAVARLTPLRDSLGCRHARAGDLTAVLEAAASIIAIRKAWTRLAACGRLEAVSVAQAAAFDELTAAIAAGPRTVSDLGPPCPKYKIFGGCTLPAGHGEQHCISVLGLPLHGEGPDPLPGVRMDAVIEPTPAEQERARATVGEFLSRLRTFPHIKTEEWEELVATTLAEHREPVERAGQSLSSWLQEWAALRPGQDAVNFLRCAAWIEKAKDAGVTEFDESGGLPGPSPAADQPREDGESSCPPTTPS